MCRAYTPFRSPISIQSPSVSTSTKNSDLADRTSSATSRARVPRLIRSHPLVIGIGLPKRPRAKSRISFTTWFKRRAAHCARRRPELLFSFRPSAPAGDVALKQNGIERIAQVVTQHGKKSIAVSSVTLLRGGHRLCHGTIDGFAEPGYLFCPLDKTIRVGFTPWAQIGKHAKPGIPQLFEQDQIPIRFAGRRARLVRASPRPFPPLAAPREKTAAFVKCSPCRGRRGFLLACRVTAPRVTCSEGTSGLLMPY
jgi:hypothetical protein